MILFANKLSPRLTYIAEFIAKELLQNTVRITTDPEEFKSFPGPRINYSERSITNDEIRVHPHELLFEPGIQEQKIDCFDFDGSRGFFRTSGDIPFDLFAACFYLLSRYEEYLPHREDEYGRYAHQNSLAFRENFLDKPIVNQWIQEFGKLLTARFPGLTSPKRPFRFIPTYDIDEAYCYREKQWWRTIGGFGRSVLHGRLSQVSERRAVLKGIIKDPYDSYDWLHHLHQDHQLKPVYFFHVGVKNGKFDKNILSSRQAMRNLIRQHAARYEIGIHPSWRSNDSNEVLKEEIRELSGIAGKTIHSSRQHYIRINLPVTYRRLIDNNILNDFSMGYGSVNGFRASTASSFYWYDLEKEEATRLLIHPFCFMDANSFFEQKQTAPQAMDEMLRFANSIKTSGGSMITIWHNNFLGTSRPFAGWKEVYEDFIKSIA